MSAPSVGMNAFLLCDYFNREGRRVDRISIAMDEGDAAEERLRAAIRGNEFELLHDVMMAEALASGETTGLDDAALALNVLLNDVTELRTPLADAREIVAIGINFRKAVTIKEIIPALETAFGGYAVSWARGVFQHLNLGTPHIH